MSVEIDVDPARVDRDVVWGYLSTQAYWGRRRTRADVDTQIDGAWRVVGAYRDGEMVGFARAVSDGVAFGYLADVFVLPDAQGAGVGKALVAAMLDGTDRFRWTLFTADAHPLYAGFGFGEPDATAMVRRPAG
ncbi:MAG: GNAT family N-acetyltransferase [Pseudonocardia sp.]|nr:GNAT family N-acetyltransferase [Pseudonocardia sp.]